MQLLQIEYVTPVGDVVFTTIPTQRTDHAPVPMNWRMRDAEAVVLEKVSMAVEVELRERQENKEPK